MAVTKKPKKSVKKTYTAAEYEKLRLMTVDLANCCVQTLATRGKLGVGSGMLMNTRTKQISHWTTQFFDALDAVGICYDRDVYMKGLKR
jgi:hypothetical protein